MNAEPESLFSFRRWLAPFRVRTFVFEHTRIRVRSFPPLFEHEWCESIADRVRRGGVVDVGPVTHVIYETIRLDRPNLILRGGRFKHAVRDGGPLIRTEMAE